MSSVTYFEFNEVYERRDSTLTEEDMNLAAAWATDEFDLEMEDWSQHTTAMWEINPEWKMQPFYEHLSRCSGDVLERYFWGISLIECCPRHMGDAPIAIDSDEVTPKAADEVLCYCCPGVRRHRLRDLQKAYKLAQEYAAEDEKEAAEAAAEEKSAREKEAAAEALLVGAPGWDIRCV
jgi:hypothetical protein